MSTIFEQRTVSWCIHTSWTDPSRHIHREFLKYQYEQHLTDRTQPNVSRVFAAQNQYGWTALAFDINGMSMIPKNARSYPSLFKKIEEEGYQYYRPNLSYTSVSHQKRKLRWMVALIFDFDHENLLKLNITNYLDLIDHVRSFGCEVSGVIKTTSGYHVYLPMQPLRGEWNGNKSIKRYDKTLKSMARMLGSDMNAASAEHYFRTPQRTNVVYFNDVQKPDFSFYESLVESRTEKSKQIKVKPESNKKPNFGRLMSQQAMLKLLSGEFSDNVIVDSKKFGRRKIGRNNAAFTLALGMKADEWTKEQATEEMKKWYEYRINKNKFSWSEVERAIGQAFDKDYKGPSPDYVEAFTGLKFRPITKRVSSEERKKMTYKSIEELVIAYLRKHYQEFEKDLMLSQSKLAEVLKVNLRSLQYVLKRMKDSQLLVMDTKRIGRSNVSRYFLDQDLLNDGADQNNTVVCEEQNDAVEPCDVHEPNDAQKSILKSSTFCCSAGTKELSSSVWSDLRGCSSKLGEDAIFHNADSSTYFLAIGRGQVLNLPAFHYLIYDWWRSFVVGGAPPGRA